MCVVEWGRGTGLRVEGRGRESRDGVESRGRGSRDGVESRRRHYSSSSLHYTVKYMSSSFNH